MDGPLLTFITYFDCWKGWPGTAMQFKTGDWVVSKATVYQTERAATVYYNFYNAYGEIIIISPKIRNFKSLLHSLV